MILTAHQPMFMPWLGLFDKISRANTFCIFDDVPFERHGFGNRNQIKTHNGAQWLTVPVHLDDHLAKPAREVRICNDHNWRRKHLRSIELAYQKAPYFKFYWPGIMMLYDDDVETLAEFNSRMLVVFMALLGIKVDIVKASERGFTGAKSDLVLDMCQKLGATEYWFGSQGRDYADLEAFARAGVKAHFQDYQHPVYEQLHGAFVPNMSILDLVMNCGPKSLRVLRNE